jgi:hydroxymethylpyrimidine kinase/phosphomethylpyrimidine kinase/thiamine-phosphate diphosphorylase
MTHEQAAVLVDWQGAQGLQLPGVEVTSRAGACARAALPTDAPPAALAAALRAQGVPAVLVLGVAPHEGGGALHWLDSTHARGWVRATGADTPTDAITVARAWNELRGLGHVAADAALLAFGPLPLLSWGDEPPRAMPAATAQEPQGMGIYAIVDTVPGLVQVLDAGVRTVQLRAKQPHDADAAWHATLRQAIAGSVAAARDHGARLIINDHWRVAAELGADMVHLGQEDLLALGEAGRAELRATGMALGISSHAVWELCRARALASAYVACGPVWPTTTKDMPWVPQGLDNLAWWVRTAGVPVVAIGGILDAAQVRQTARAGADGVCVLRGLGSEPKRVVPALQEAFRLGRAERAAAPLAPARPHPTLESRE